jgi:hypothetical protein
VAYNGSTSFSIAAATTTIIRTRFGFFFSGFAESAGEGGALAVDTPSAASVSAAMPAANVTATQDLLSPASGSLTPSIAQANAVGSSRLGHGRHSAFTDAASETSDASLAALDTFFAGLDSATPAMLVS